MEELTTKFGADEILGVSRVEETEKPAPAPAPLPAPTRARAERAPKQTPAQKWLGSAEAIMLHKRRGGKRELIDTYRYEELEGCRDLEHFIQTYVMPQHGPGTYAPTYIDKAGKETVYPDITIAAPITGPSSSVFGAKDIMEVQDKARREALAEQERIRQIEKEAQERSGGLTGGVLDLMREQAQAHTRLLERSLEEGGKTVPLPPPPPAPDVAGMVNAIMTPVMTMMQGMMAMMQSQVAAMSAPKDTSSSDEKWARMLAEERERAREERDRERERRTEERERAREERERERQFYQLQMETVKAQSTTDPIEKTLKTFELMDKLKEAAGADGGNSMADVFGQIAEKLPDILRAANDGKRQAAAGLAGLTQQAKVAQQKPVQAVKQEAKQEEKADDEEAEEEDSDNTSSEIPEKLAVPAEAKQAIERMLAAETEEDRIQGALLVFQLLHASGGGWQAGINQLLLAVKTNDDKKAIQWVEAILAKLVDSDAFSEEDAKKMLTSIEDSWNAVADTIRRL